MPGRARSYKGDTPRPIQTCALFVDKRCKEPYVKEQGSNHPFAVPADRPLDAAHAVHGEH
eukprot:12916243-Prorocentrum_lima.AAC.1